MKYFIVFVFHFFFLVSADAQENSTILIINNKELKDSLISKEQLSNICSMNVLFTRTGETRAISSFVWVVSASGSIHKGFCPGEVLLPPNLKNGDVVFIEELKLDEGKTTLPGQFVFKLQ